MPSAPDHSGVCEGVGGTTQRRNMHIWIVEKHFNGKTYPCVWNYPTKKLAIARKKEMEEVGYVAKLKVVKYIRKEPA